MTSNTETTRKMTKAKPKTKINSRREYLTEDLKLAHSAEPNHHHVKTNLGWLLARADVLIASGMPDIVVVTYGKGLGALAHRDRIVKGDRVVYPV